SLPDLCSYSFGRMAKFVAIYIKTMAGINPNGPCNLAHHAHPPIDRQLLTALSECTALDSSSRTVYRRTVWTEMKEDRYAEIIALLRADFPNQPMWKIEQFWSMQAE